MSEEPEEEVDEVTEEARDSGDAGDAGGEFGVGDGGEEGRSPDAAGVDDAGGEYGADHGTERDRPAGEPAPGEAGGAAPRAEETVPPETKYCTNCGSEIDAIAEICPECGVRQTSGSASSSDEADPGVAAILSLLIPGAGQLINGQTERAAMVFGGLIAAWFVGGFLAVVLAFIPFVGWLLAMLIGLLLLLYNPLAAFDAYNQAQKINAGEVQVD